MHVFCYGSPTPSPPRSSPPPTPTQIHALPFSTFQMFLRQVFPPPENNMGEAVLQAEKRLSSCSPVTLETALAMDAPRSTLTWSWTYVTEKSHLLPIHEIHRLACPLSASQPNTVLRVPILLASQDYLN